VIYAYAKYTIGFVLMKNIHKKLNLSALTLAILSSSPSVFSAENSNNNAVENTAPIETLATLTFDASEKKDPDISAIPKTIISREEMLQYGDQSVNDALRRASGIQMPTPGQGPRGGNGAMRFRGGGAPVFLINGEPVQGGPRGGMSIVDTLTPDMIERIEIVKQPSVAQASVASSAVINIILKEPLDGTTLSGNVRVGYGLAKSDKKEEERKNISVQMDGRDSAWVYSISANQMWNDSTSQTRTESSDSGVREQKRVTERSSFMFSPRLEYLLDDEQKLIAEIFYRNNQTDGRNKNQTQDDQNDSIRLNTRYERKENGNSDKLRFSVEKQHETEKTRGDRQSYIDETITEYGLAYDGVRKFDDTKQLKFGADARTNELESNVAKTLNEDRYALYAEGSWKFSDRQTITVGARQEWLERSGLVDYSESKLSPVLAHRFDFNDHWSLQTNLSQAFRSPKADNLMPTVSVSTDQDAGEINNPDRGGNEFLKPEKISAIESTLGYNTPSGGVNVTAYHRKIDDYIEKVIRLESNGRYVERPQNQDNATTYGVEVAGRYALKQTENGHSFMLNAQVSTVRAKVEEENGKERLASDVAPYTASTGLSYNYQPWRLATSLNVNYTPEFTRTLDNQPYKRTTNQRVNVDISATKRFDNQWSATLSARNIFSTDYKEKLTNEGDGSLYQSRVSESIPSVLFSLEKKF
jgi:outer membrane receptor for ferrienterochelin and colicins